MWKTYNFVTCFKKIHFRAEIFGKFLARVYLCSGVKRKKKKKNIAKRYKKKKKYDTK